jgi:hypothetical protein
MSACAHATALAADKDHDGKLDRKELSLAGESVFWLFETRLEPSN